MFQTPDFPPWIPFSPIHRELTSVTTQQRMHRASQGHRHSQEETLQLSPTEGPLDSLCLLLLSSIYQHRFHSGFEIQFWGCTLSFIIRQLVLFCHTFAVCNAAFHPYHVLDRCTAHDVGIDEISLRAIFMKVTQMSLTVHICSVYNSVSLVSVVDSRVFNLLGYMYFYNT